MNFTTLRLRISTRPGVRLLVRVVAVLGVAAIVGYAVSLLQYPVFVLPAESQGIASINTPLLLLIAAAIAGFLFFSLRGRGRVTAEAAPRLDEVSPGTLAFVILLVAAAVAVVLWFVWSHYDWNWQAYGATLGIVYGGFLGKLIEEGTPATVFTGLVGAMCGITADSWTAEAAPGLPKTVLDKLSAVVTSAFKAIRETVGENVPTTFYPSLSVFLWTFAVAFLFVMGVAKLIRGNRAGAPAA